MNKMEMTFFVAVAVAAVMTSVGVQARLSEIVEYEPVMSSGFDSMLNDRSRFLKGGKKGKGKGKGKSKKSGKSQKSKGGSGKSGKKSKGKGKSKSKGKGKGKGKSKSKGKSSDLPPQSSIPTDVQTCALFGFFSPLASGDCPTSDFFCPTIRPHRLDDSVVCIASFNGFCERNFGCTGGNANCIDVIQRCCTGWCDVDLTQEERADFFEIVAADPTGSSCDVYSDVLCPDENQIDYACTDMTTFENYCNTFTDFNNSTAGADCLASMNCCCP